MKLLIPLFITAALLPSLAAPQDCIDYGDYLHWVGEVDTPRVAVCAAISGNHAYVAQSGTTSGKEECR